tara:strand:+ start:529 stop:708 length:180 start_codon:yes stop_codon:yes gene_type:complete
MIKSVRYIQIKKVAYCPNIFKEMITYRPHPTEYDESDDLEYQKYLIEKFKGNIKKGNLK